MSSEGLPLNSFSRRPLDDVSSLRHPSNRKVPRSFSRILPLFPDAVAGASVPSSWGTTTKGLPVCAFSVSLKNLLMFFYSSTVERFCFIESINRSTMDRCVPLTVGTGTGIACLSGTSTLNGSRKSMEMATSSTISSCIILR